MGDAEGADDLRDVCYRVGVGNFSVVFGVAYAETAAEVKLFYLKAELPLPSEEFYEDYSQIENGVGMITSLKTEFYRELEYLDEYTEN